MCHNHMHYNPGKCVTLDHAKQELRNARDMKQFDSNESALMFLFRV